MISDTNISRWRERADRSLEILAKRLGDFDSPKPDAQGLNMLSLTYASVGYAHVAASDFSGARTAFSNAVLAMNRVYDLITSGHAAANGYDRSGNFQILLMAHATGDSDLISSFLRRFTITPVAVAAGPDDSTYFASTCIALSAGDIEVAASHLAEHRPNIDPLFFGYDQCLTSITKRDKEAFVTTLCTAASSWHSYATRQFEGLPRSACFLDGVGLLHLARKVLGDAALTAGSPYIPESLIMTPQTNKVG